NSKGDWYVWNGAGWSGSADPLSSPPFANLSTGGTQPPANPSTGGTQPAHAAPIPFVNTLLPNTVPLTFALQNTQSTTLSPHEVSFGEVFSPSQVPAGSQLVATINGVNYAVQLDVKTSYSDGSVESGILTLDAPAIPANTTLNAVLSSVAAPTTPSV